MSRLEEYVKSDDSLPDEWQELARLRRLFRALYDEIEKENYNVTSQAGEVLIIVELDDIRKAFERFTGSDMKP